MHSLQTSQSVSGNQFLHAPAMGEVWDHDERMVIICGQGPQQHGLIWVMDWKSGSSAYVDIADLTPRQDGFPEFDDAKRRLGEHAAAGNADAMWWLHRFYVRKQHARSVWYAIAAIRRKPQTYGAKLRGLRMSAYDQAFIETGAPVNIDFLARIPEIHGAQPGKDWQSAVLAAAIAQNVLLPMDASETTRILSQLVSGRTVTVQQHRMWMDCGYLGVTNPYGVDMLVGDPTRENIASLWLSLMAGECIGPEPLVMA